MSKIPSPCIDVCKYKLKGHCIACSMTKAQKSGFKKLKKAGEQRQFLEMLRHQQQVLGGKFKGWTAVYRRKCAKKGAPCSF